MAIRDHLVAKCTRLGIGFEVYYTHDGVAIRLRTWKSVNALCDTFKRSAVFTIKTIGEPNGLEVYRYELRVAWYNMVHNL